MNTRQEALQIIKEFGLKEVPKYFLHNKEASIRKCSEKDGDSKVILEVPPDVFYKLVERYNPSYAFEYAIPGDNSGGYGPRYVWFVTKSKLRIMTETLPLSSYFMEEILYPSYMAQESKVAERIGSRKTTFEELKNLGREMGFSVYDPITRKWVEKIKLLPPAEASKHRGKMFIFHMKTKNG